MDIFTINLDSRPDRWNRVMAIQRAYPWARFHRIAAVQIPLFPMAACTVSHQLAVLMASVENMPSITVAEDDLEPTKYFEHWPAVVAKAAELGLDYVVGAVATREDCARGGRALDVPHVPQPTGTPVSLVEAHNGRGTHLITYFERAYPKILGFQFGTPIDVGITMHPELRGGFAMPFVAVQGDGYSDLCNRPYGTPALYLKSSEVWSERLNVRDVIDWPSELAPVVPHSDGIESVRRLTMMDLIAGRPRKSPAFGAAKYLEGRLDG